MKLVNTITGSTLSVDDELGAQLLADGGYDELGAAARSAKKAPAKKAPAKKAPAKTETPPDPPADDDE